MSQTNSIQYRLQQFVSKEKANVFYGDGFLEVTRDNKTKIIKTWKVPEETVEAELLLLGFQKKRKW